MNSQAACHSLVNCAVTEDVRMSCAVAADIYHPTYSQPLLPDMPAFKSNWPSTLSVGYHQPSINQSINQSHHMSTYFNYLE